MLPTLGIRVSEYQKKSGIYFTVIVYFLIKKVKKAKAIVVWRKSHGRFKKVEDLLAVKGIGKSTLSKNKGRIIL